MEQVRTAINSYLQFFERAVPGNVMGGSDWQGTDPAHWQAAQVAQAAGVPQGAPAAPAAPYQPPEAFASPAAPYGGGAGMESGTQATTGGPLADRKSTRLNSSHLKLSRMPSSA